MESVYSTLFLDALKLRTFHIVVKNVANGRCLRICLSYLNQRASVVIGNFTYHREASAGLLVQLRWAKRRPQGVGRATVQTSRFLRINQSKAKERVRRQLIKSMHNYRVAFIVKGKQLNAWFASPIQFTGKADNQKQFREMATLAVQEYLREARSIPKTGTAEALAIWPEILPSKGVIQPLDAFELND